MTHWPEYCTNRPRRNGEKLISSFMLVYGNAEEEKGWLTDQDIVITGVEEMVRKQQ